MPERTVCCFGEGKLLNLLTLTQGSAILSGIQSPAENWRPRLVCVVAVVCPLELNQRAPAGVPLLSLLVLVYAIIRISTKEVKVNTQQVLTVSALTGKPL